MHVSQKGSLSEKKAVDSEKRNVQTKRFDIQCSESIFNGSNLLG